MSIIFVLFVILCGSLASSSGLSESCRLHYMNGTDEYLEHEKNYTFKCNLGANIHGMQMIECFDGVWHISPCIGKIAILIIAFKHF